MDKTLILKDIADETRMNILTMLLRHNYCVRALAKQLKISEAAVSQHLKVLREAGLLTGEKRGYYMHYDVNREVLHMLAKEIDALAEIQREACQPEDGECPKKVQVKCHSHHKEECSDLVKEFCHGHEHQEQAHIGPCKCHHS